MSPTQDWLDVLATLPAAGHDSRLGVGHHGRPAYGFLYAGRYDQQIEDGVTALPGSHCAHGARLTSAANATTGVHSPSRRVRRRGSAAASRGTSGSGRRRASLCGGHQRSLQPTRRPVPVRARGVPTPDPSVRRAGSAVPDGADARRALRACSARFSRRSGRRPPRSTAGQIGKAPISARHRIPGVVTAM